MEGKKRSLIIATLIIVALIPHWRTILLGELPLPEGYLALIAPETKNYLVPTPWNALWWDGIGQFWAWRTEAVRQLREGKIPLWTNRIGCGFPFLANPQTQSLYPPIILGEWMLEIGERLGRGRNQPLPLRSARLMAWMAFLHSLLALTGAYLLMRSMGVSRLASVVGSTAYGLGSFQMAWALLPTLTATAAWLPLTLWLVRRFFAVACSEQAKTDFSLRADNLSKIFGYSVALSLSLTMLLLAGHGQIAIYSLLAVLVFALVETFWVNRGASGIVWGIFVSSFVSSFAISAAQLLPTIELTPLTHRHGPPTWEGYRAFASRGLTISEWATMVLPFLFGNPTDGSYFGKESFADYCAYAGTGILLLAVVRVASSFSNFSPRKRFDLGSPAFSHSLALFLLGALLASGSTLNLPLYFLLPGFSQLGTPSRAVFLCQLAVGILAAKALDEPEKLAVSGKWIVAAALFLPLGVVFGVGFWLQTRTTGFSWLGWLSLNASQNIGVLLGIFAFLLFSLRLTLSSNPKLIRYGVAVLLLGELTWFAAQQIPTAKASMVEYCLQVAERKLTGIVKTISNPYNTPRRFLPLGSDWSLLRYPQSLLVPNSILLLQLPIADARNYDSLLLRHHKAVMALFSEGNPCPFENGNLILMPRKWMDFDAAKKLAQIVGADAVVEAFGGDLKVALRHKDQTRARVPVHIRYISDLEEAWDQLLVIPEDMALLMAEPQKHEGFAGDRASVVNDDDSIVKLKIHQTPVKSPLPNSGRQIWIILSDIAYPGWLAFSKPADKQWRQLSTGIANGAFRACHLPNSAWEVVWVYFPSSFAIGAFLSCVGVFSLFLVLALFLPIDISSR